jgi:hypothetical protein
LSEPFLPSKRCVQLRPCWLGSPSPRPVIELGVEH